MKHLAQQNLRGVTSSSENPTPNLMIKGKVEFGKHLTIINYRDSLAVQVVFVWSVGLALMVCSVCRESDP